MAITKREWTTVGKLTLVSFIIGGGLLAYYGGREAVRYFQRVKIDEGKQKILTDLKESIKTAPALIKKPLSPEEVEKLLSDWDTDLSKLSPSAFETFMNYFNLTIAVGKCKVGDEKCGQNSWISDNNKDSTELQKRKDALDKFVTWKTEPDGKLTEIYDGTAIMEKFYDYENTKLKTY